MPRTFRGNALLLLVRIRTFRRFFEPLDLCSGLVERSSHESAASFQPDSGRCDYVCWAWTCLDGDCQQFAFSTGTIRQGIVAAAGLCGAGTASARAGA